MVNSTLDSKDALHYDLLKTTEQAELITAIKEIMKEGDAHNLENFNLDYWQWQYQNLPTNNANVYVVRNNANKILAYYHVPIYSGNFNNTVQPYAMIQDVAVSNTLRGRGVFKDLAVFANQHLDSQNINVIYTFPNHKSIHTFVKYNGFTTIAELPAYILPLSTSKIVRSKLNIPVIPHLIGLVADSILKIKSLGLNKNYETKIHDIFDAQLVNIFANYNQDYLFCLEKSEEYLNWRFVQKGKHFIVSLKDKNTNTINAVAVFKKDIIMNMDCLLLMDFAYLKNESKSLVQLIAHVKKFQTNIFSGKFALIFTSANTKFNTSFSKVGFFKIPANKNPRPLNLLVRSKTNNKEILNPQNWNITLSDWDVF